MVKPFKFERKLGLSDVIAFAALIMSGIAIWQSCAARQDVRIIHHLDLQPKLLIESYLNENSRISPHFTIKNEGAVDAVQVVIQLSFLTVSIDSSETARAAFIDKENPRKIARLPVMGEVSFPLQVSQLVQNLSLANPPKYSVVEILVLYKRETDLKQFAKRTFYYLNPEGRLVTEYDNSLPREIYAKVIEAVHKSSAFKMSSGDVLQPVRNLEDPTEWPKKN